MAAAKQSYNPFRFIRESWLELKKVHHPTRQETIQGTVAVLFMIFIVAIFLGTVDFGLGWVVAWAMGA